ncbi:MAG TPA: sigma-70 family RNA polymerase sigma factor [Polyangiales bacterium]
MLVESADPAPLTFATVPVIPLGVCRPRKTASAPLAREEHVLLERLISGDECAWRDFFHRYDRLIVATIGRILRGFPNATCEVDKDDVYGELLLGLSSNGCHKLRTYEPGRGASLSTWVCLLATRATWDYLRRIKRRGALHEQLALEHTSELSADPLAALLDQEQHRAATHALHSLSTRDLELVELLYVGGKSPEEAAEELGISVKTVYTKKHKIMVRLTGLLKEN